MSHIPTSSRFHGVLEATQQCLKNAASHGLPHVKHYLWLTFISGPKLLLTSRISVPCAFFMGLMCSPALLLCSILTFPSLIFQSPQQNAYFYFSEVLEKDPTRWVVLLLSGVCALMSMAVPATMPRPNDSVGY